MIDINAHQALFRKMWEEDRAKEEEVRLQEEERRNAEEARQLAAEYERTQAQEDAKLRRLEAFMGYTRGDRGTEGDTPDAAGPSSGSSLRDIRTLQRAMRERLRNPSDPGARDGLDQDEDPTGRRERRGTGEAEREDEDWGISSDEEDVMGA